MTWDAGITTEIADTFASLVVWDRCWKGDGLAYRIFSPATAAEQSRLRWELKPCPYPGCSLSVRPQGARYCAKHAEVRAAERAAGLHRKPRPDRPCVHPGCEENRVRVQRGQYCMRHRDRRVRARDIRSDLGQQCMREVG